MPVVNWTPERRQAHRDAVARYKKRFPEKVKARLKRWQQDNREHLRAYGQRQKLAKNYGLTPEQKQERIDKQNGRCAVCGTADPGGRWKTFATDHNHQTGKVRSELCNSCNKALGLFKDSPCLLRDAAQYLESWA